MNAPAPRAPQKDAGKLLARLPRGHTGEVHLTLEQWGHGLTPVLVARLWKRNDKGELWPTGTGVSFKMNDLPALQALIAELLKRGELALRQELAAATEGA